MAIPTNKSIKTVTYNGTTIPIAHNNQSKSTTTNGTITPDSGYDGLSSVTVNVPTGTARSSSDLTVSGATVSVPSGLYSSNVSKSVASGSAGTPTATKGTVSNHSVSITPSVTNTTGYITGGTKTGSAVSVSASELVSGTANIVTNGSVDVTNLSSASVNVPASAVTSGTKSITTTGTVDVTTYKNAQVSDANLIASNILSGVSILGVAGSYKPKYIDFGTFTPSSATSGVTVNHNLGVKPQLVIIIKKTSSHAQAGYVSMISVSQDSNKKFFYYGSAGYSYSNSPSNKQLGYGAGGLDTTDESSTAASYKTWGGAYAATSTTFKVARPAESIILDAVEYYYIAIAGVE